MDENPEFGRLLVEIRSLRIEIAASGRTVLEGGGLQIRAGDRLAVTGPSGSGKTVFALAVLGLLKFRAPGLLSKCDIRWSAGINSPGFGVGYCPQGTAGHLNPYLPVGMQLVQAAVSARKGSAHAEIEADARRLLESLDLPAASIWRVFPHELSGGMAQRVSIALSLLVRPRLVIIDEPATALDGYLRKQVFGVMKSELDRWNSALIVTTHLRCDVEMLAREELRINGSCLGARCRMADSARESGESHPPEARASIVTSNEPPFGAGGQPCRPEPVVSLRGLAVQPGRTSPRGTAARFQLGALDLEVKRGERVGLWGSSGSGKTTLIRAVAGLETPVAGAIEVLGLNINSVSPARLRNLRSRFQVCFQSSHQTLNPFKTVAELLREPSLLHGFESPSAEAIDDFLQRCDLGPALLNRMPSEMSFGQCQRVALGRLLCFFPTIELFLLDEPLVGLGSSERNLLVELMLEKLVGKTVIAASHDHGLLDILSTSLVCLDMGRILETSQERPWRWAAPETASKWDSGLLR